MLLILVIDTVLISTDIKVCGNEGDDCFHSLGVLRVSLGCYVSFTYQNLCFMMNHYTMHVRARTHTQLCMYTCIHKYILVMTLIFRKKVLSTPWVLFELNMDHIPPNLTYCNSWHLILFVIVSCEELHLIPENFFYPYSLYDQ